MGYLDMIGFFFFSLITIMNKLEEKVRKQVYKDFNDECIRGNFDLIWQKFYISK